MLQPQPLNLHTETYLLTCLDQFEPTPTYPSPVAQLVSWSEIITRYCRTPRSEIHSPVFLSQHSPVADLETHPHYESNNNEDDDICYAVTLSQAFTPPFRYLTNPSRLLLPSTKLATNKRRSLSSTGGSLLNRMFGSNSNSAGNKSETDSKSDKSSPETSPGPSAATPIKTADKTADKTVDKTVNKTGSAEKRSGNGSPPTRQDTGGPTDKKRRSSSVSSKASSLLASAKNSLSFSQGSRAPAVEMTTQSPLQRLGKQDPALAVPQGQHNNSAGESVAGPKSTFHVGVWEDRNKKCRRTMEDTHAFLYNFIQTPTLADASGKDTSEGDDSESAVQDIVESDNGYFAIFDGHAGTFAADWCGKKLHIILEELIRKNPNAQIPEVLDLAFTTADSQLEKLPLKNSGCTAAVAVLRWEDRVSNDRSNLDAAASATLKPTKSDDSSQSDKDKSKDAAPSANEVKNPPVEGSSTKVKGAVNRQRLLYTANVGDARIILCRAGKALRLSYDHKGSDEVEGKRIANAGGLILNNRVNGVLAVTRALGDAYMKKLVTGHPYTTETVIQADSDEFIIIACDGVSGTKLNY